MSPVIDVHAHVLVPEVERLVRDEPFLAAAREEGATGQTQQTRDINAALMADQWGRELVDIDTRLAAMDAMGVDVQVLSVSPYQYHYGAPPPSPPISSSWPTSASPRWCPAIPTASAPWRPSRSSIRNSPPNNWYGPMPRTGRRPS